MKARLLRLSNDGANVNGQIKEMDKFLKKYNFPKFWTRRNRKFVIDLNWTSIKLNSGQEIFQQLKVHRSRMASQPWISPVIYGTNTYPHFQLSRNCREAVILSSETLFYEATINSSQKSYKDATKKKTWQCHIIIIKSERCENLNVLSSWIQ